MINQCKICQRELKSLFALPGHLRYQHNKMTIKEYYDRFFKKNNEGVCLVCGNNTKFVKITTGYQEFCSVKCSNKGMGERIKKTYKEKYRDNPILMNQITQKRKQTCLQKYGTENYQATNECKEKYKQTCLKKYGVTNIFAAKEIDAKIKQTHMNRYGKIINFSDPTIQAKIKQLNQKKYGVDYPYQSIVIRDKIKQNFIKNQGVDNPFKSNIIQDQIKQTNIQKYGVDNPQKNKEIKQVTIKTFFENQFKKICDKFECIPLFDVAQYNGVHVKSYNWQCKKCGQQFQDCIKNGHIPKCPICYPQKRSQPQQDVFEYVCKLGVNAIQNSRSIIQDNEIDIYVPDKKIAIEFNGNYWHSEVFGQKDKKYHLNKLILCETAGIKLIQIFEDEWNLKRKIVKSRLRNILGCNKYKIFARNCEIKEINNQIKSKFLEKYHIQGNDRSAIKIGAFYKNRLVGVMTFGNLRVAMGNKNIKNVFELIRFCTINNFSVVGIASKMFQYFLKNYKPIEIISYADRRWSQGNLYYKIGFNFDHFSNSNYWYMDNYTKRFHRFNFRKNVLSKKLQIFDEKLTEWDNMRNNGYDRIWDCGNMIFKWSKNGPQN